MTSNSPGEEKKDTQRKVAGSGTSTSENQPKKVDSAKPEKTGAVEKPIKSLVSSDALSIYARIDKIITEIAAKDDQDQIIKGLLKIKSTTYNDLNSTEVDNRPSPDDKKVMRLTLKANKAFKVAAKAQLDLERKNLDAVIAKSSKDLSNQILDDKYGSLYFLKKNKGHIKKKAVEILIDYKKVRRNFFRNLKDLSTGRSKGQMKRFENQILELIKENDSNLYKKITGVQSFRDDIISYLRVQIQNL